MKASRLAHFLILDQRMVGSFLGEEALVLAQFYDGTVGKYGDFIRALDGAQSMGNDEAASASHEGVQRHLYFFFARSIQCAGCLIQNQQIRIA